MDDVYSDSGSEYELHSSDIDSSDSEIDIVPERLCSSDSDNEPLIKFKKAKPHPLRNLSSITGNVNMLNSPLISTSDAAPDNQQPSTSNAALDNQQPSTSNAALDNQQPSTSDAAVNGHEILTQGKEI